MAVSSAVLFLSACGSPGEMMLESQASKFELRFVKESQQHNKELLSRFIQEVWNRGDIEAANKYVAPIYTIHHDPGDPWDHQVLDLAKYKERVRLSRAPFPEQRFFIHDLVAEGNRVVMTWDWVGTQKGNLPGFPATGKQIRTSGMTVYFVENGRFTGHWQVVDRLGVYTQLRQEQTK